MAEKIDLKKAIVPPYTRFLYLNEVDLRDRKVFIRADLNVPYDDNQNITDDGRLRAIIPTINFALDQGAAVILSSHMGRPEGVPDPRLSLYPVSRRLARLLNKDVQMAPDCVGQEVARMSAALKPGQLLLLENLRFHPGEENNDDDFARQLADLADVYCNDAFAVSHRAHASVSAIARHMPVCAAGFLLKNELLYFHQALEDPARPLAAIIGGGKVAAKLPAMQNLLNVVDKVIVGGSIANTFLKAIHPSIGSLTMVEEEMVDEARSIMRHALDLGVKFYLPVDCLTADRFDRKADTRITPVQEVPDDWMIVDVGPASNTLFGEALQDAKTILWNGPMGAYEIEAFSRGTLHMAQTLAGSYALTIVCGGDTDAAVHKAGVSSRISFISSAGGAFLKLIEGGAVPGLDALHEQIQPTHGNQEES